MPNRLIHSTSPYLLQHAHNPVDWYEWGKEALEKAVAEDKPIIVSIGYSACHWCHVMEHESFENPEIADIMNEFFVCVKVDREERPDIDHVYMEAVQAMQQNGGWPLNVFLTPNQQPFFGGTYFPAKNWSLLLRQINHAFREKRAEINQSAESLCQHLQTSDLHRFANGTADSFKRESLDNMFQILSKRFDTTWGGLEKSPKFVMPSIWLFLLRYHAATKDEQALHMVSHTLKQLAFGGIYDQLGGGFSRYSVDAEWFAPHFEKMLYDNAQLLSLYSEAYALTKDKLFRDVVYQTIDWLKREMRHPGGGFYSALDADSEGVEGKFYTWTKAEIQAVVGEDSDFIMKHFESSASGNWEDGRNIFRRNRDTEETTESEKIKTIKQKLLTARNQRIRPGLDDKILTGWNALTIQGLVDAYKTFQEPEFLALALQAISFLENHLIEGGKVYRAFKINHSDTEGFLEDYAFLIQAYTALYQVTFHEGWLHKASTWCDYVKDNFYDTREGYFFISSGSAEALIARKKEIFDNVIPGSNSVMARNLFVLGELLDRDDWKELSNTMVSKLYSMIKSEPNYMCHWAVLLTEIIQGLTEVVISGEDALTYRQEIHQHFFPFTVSVGTRDKSELGLLAGREAKPHETWIYICQHQTCKLPVNNPSDAVHQLKSL